MNLHEFQAKELLARFGIEIPVGRIAGTASDAERIAERQGFARSVIKAQVRSNNRKAAGGVVFADNPRDVAAVAGRMLATPLSLVDAASSRRPARAGGDGARIEWVYIEQFVECVAEIYAAVVIDSTRGRLMLLASKTGGEQVDAHFTGASGRTPDGVVERDISLTKPNAAGLYLGVAHDLGFSGTRAMVIASVFERMVTAARALDASLLEINPLGLTADDRAIALDAKMTIDDNALFRHPDLLQLKTIEALDAGDPLAAGADLHQINYIEMDGDIGVVANGAGLALATLDIVTDLGGHPANFMDIRTTATSQDIAYGYRLLSTRKNTRAILVNVHGGGMQRCDTIAEGIAIALAGSARRLPLVVRFDGNNAAFARERLRGAGIAFEAARDIRDAAERVVDLSQRGRL